MPISYFFREEKTPKFKHTPCSGAKLFRFHIIAQFRRCTFLGENEIQARNGEIKVAAEKIIVAFISGDNSQVRLRRSIKNGLPKSNGKNNAEK